MSEDDRARWDAFVFDRDDATFFHRAGWARVLEKGAGHRPFFLIAEDAAGAIQGVLPLALIKSLVFGRSLVSIPFGTYGGPLVASDDALAALDAAAAEIADRHKADYVEYRSITRHHSDWPVKDGLYVTFRRKIEDDAEANLKAIPRKQRAEVRKGINKYALSAEVDRNVDRFFHLYALSVRNLGTPVFPKKLFRTALEVFGEDADILTVLDSGGAPVCSVLSYYFRGEVLPYFGGGGITARTLSGNDYMYWALMDHARNRGCTMFDFGRSKRDTGAYKFKKLWGFEPQPLEYEYNLRRMEAIPEVNPLNPKYRTMIATWKRLPLPVANRIGPMLARHLG